MTEHSISLGQYSQFHDTSTLDEKFECMEYFLREGIRDWVAS